ncbi:unnamed protein product [Paramecium octaurelia]|uniref:Uncharacterized protein n=1 Tax=Paramecium octaurelia TaxID=43137 RepID=A0A8S1V204_PAROT|nr:unnamed protein product [Paramecium octaurelia]
MQRASQIMREENEIEKDICDKKKIRYNQQLINVKQILQIKEVELINCKKALEESE